MNIFVLCIIHETNTYGNPSWADFRATRWWEGMSRLELIDLIDLIGSVPRDSTVLLMFGVKRNPYHPCKIWSDASFAPFRHTQREIYHGWYPDVRELLGVSTGTSKADASIYLPSIYQEGRRHCKAHLIFIFIFTFQPWPEPALSALRLLRPCHIATQSVRAIKLQERTDSKAPPQKAKEEPAKKGWHWHRKTWTRPAADQRKGRTAQIAPRRGPMVLDERTYPTWPSQAGVQGRQH